MSDVIEAEATIIEEAISPLAGAERWLAQKRAAVAEEAERHAAFEVTDSDSYRQAKRERGAVNKAVRAIDAERIDKMKAITAAVAQFKADTDEVTAPLKEISKALDAECKRWEAQVIARRRAMLCEAYEDAAPLIALPAEGDADPLVPFDRVLARFGEGQLGKRWLLFGTSDEVARTQLMEAIGKMADAEKTIRAMVAEQDRDTVRALYFSTLDMDAAMARARELAEQRERILAMEREREEMERRRLAEQEAARAAERERLERDAHAQEVRAAREKAEADYRDGYRTGVLDMPGNKGGATVTREQMNAIDMVKNGVAAPVPAKVAPVPAPDVRRELLNGMGDRARVTLAFEQPVSELVLDVTPQELELFRRVLRYNHVRGVIRQLRRK